MKKKSNFKRTKEYKEMKSHIAFLEDMVRHQEHQERLKDPVYKMANDINKDMFSSEQPRMIGLSEQVGLSTLNIPHMSMERQLSDADKEVEALEKKNKRSMLKAALLDTLTMTFAILALGGYIWGVMSLFDYLGGFGHTHFPAVLVLILGIVIPLLGVITGLNYGDRMAWSKA